MSVDYPEPLVHELNHDKQSARYELLCIHVKHPQVRGGGWYLLGGFRFQGESCISLICGVYPPSVSFMSLSELFKRSWVSVRQQTYIQVTEVFIVVQGIADDKVVGDFKSNIYQSKRRQEFRKKLKLIWSRKIWNINYALLSAFPS